MTPGQRLRAIVNWVNLSTPLGLLVARIGRASVVRGPAGTRLASGYCRRVPLAPAFTVGNVILTRRPSPPEGALLVHECRHSTQYALLGPLFLPVYGLLAAWSWSVTGDWGARNKFEHWAGLADGGYVDRPLRPGLVRIGEAVTRRSRR